jgi:hypothetical protein
MSQPFDIRVDALQTRRGETVVEIQRRFRRRLPDLVECVADRAIFWPALMLGKVGLKLLDRLVSVNEKFLARLEGQLADIAIRHARGAADESNDLEIPVWHAHMIAGQVDRVKWLPWLGCGLKP